jgi:predicted DNA-binding protein (UPF0251 family)
MSEQSHLPLEKAIEPAPMPARSLNGVRLTPSEIESLRKELRESMSQGDEFWRMEKAGIRV